MKGSLFAQEKEFVSNRVDLQTFLFTKLSIIYRVNSSMLSKLYSGFNNNIVVLFMFVSGGKI